MKDLILRVWNKIRFSKSNIIVNGKPFVSPKTEVSVQVTLVLGRGVRTERGSFIAARKNAKLELGTKVYLNRNTCIVAKESIVIGNYVDIGPNVCIYDHDHSDKEESGFVTEPIMIGDNVWIGSNCTILKGVNIGENSVIAAGSVITHDVPDNSIVYQKKTDTIVKKQGGYNN